MITNADITDMLRDLSEVIGDNSVDILIRRNGVNLSGQTVRIAKGGGGRSGQVNDPDLGANLTPITVLGPITLDIQAQDRFTLNGTLFEVVTIHPNRRAGTQAEAQRVS